MLAVVKTPPIELAITGEGAKKVLAWISRKFDLRIISPEAAENDAVNIQDTEFWTEMQRNRTGNLLEAARLKAGMTQKQVAEAAGIRQNMVSDYENGRRRLSRRMAGRFSNVLKVKPERFFNQTQ